MTGTEGTVIVEAGQLRVRELKDEKGETNSYGGKLPAGGGDQGQGKGTADPANISYGGHREQLADLLQAIETGRKPLIEGREVRKPLEIILAAYESARSGRDVTLPLPFAQAAR